MILEAQSVRNLARLLYRVGDVGGVDERDEDEGGGGCSNYRSPSLPKDSVIK